MKGKCLHCDQEHDLASMEPSCGMPDVVFSMTPAARRRWCVIGKNLCLKAEGDKPLHEHFVRVLMPMPVAGRNPLNWGVWVKVDAEDFFTLVDVYDSKNCVGPEWRGTIANMLPGYAVTLGLTGVFTFRNLTDIPYLTLDASQLHQLVTDQRDGVPSTRALEWLIAIHHPGVTS